MKFAVLIARIANFAKFNFYQYFKIDEQKRLKAGSNKGLVSIILPRLLSQFASFDILSISSDTFTEFVWHFIYIRYFQFLNRRSPNCVLFSKENLVFETLPTP